jgi:hypothetical protein
MSSKRSRGFIAVKIGRHAATLERDVFIELFENSVVCEYVGSLKRSPRE